MRATVLYLRSRRVPAALATACGATALVWVLWTVFSTERDVVAPLVVLLVLLLVTTVAGTLAGPDDALERTAGRPWPLRRAAHLAGALAVVVLLLAATVPTGARFGPVRLVIWDAAGLLGLAALGAVTLGAHRSWFLPVGWTMPALVAAGLSPTLADNRIVLWSLWAGQPGEWVGATTAAVLAVAGTWAYAAAGPALHAPVEAGQN